MEGVIIKIIITIVLLGIVYFIYAKISKKKITNDKSKHQNKNKKTKVTKNLL